MTTTILTADIRDIGKTLWRFEDEALHHYCYAIDSDGLYCLACKTDWLIIWRYESFDELMEFALLWSLAQ